MALRGVHGCLLTERARWVVRPATYGEAHLFGGSEGIGISFRTGLFFASVRASSPGMVDLGAGSSANATLGKFRPRR
jgi:hypothetical protein